MDSIIVEEFNSESPDSQLNADREPVSSAVPSSCLVYCCSICCLALYLLNAVPSAVPSFRRSVYF